MAPTGSGIVWKTPPSVLIDGLEAYERRVIAAVHAVATYWSPIVESYAKEHKPWENRTANAQQSLFSLVDLAEDTVTLYLSHGVEYGKWLELCNAGKYAIIMKTLQAHYGPIMKMLDDIFAD